MDPLTGIQLPTQVDLRKVGGKGFNLMGKTRFRAVDTWTQYQGQKYSETGSRTALRVGYYNDIESEVIITSSPHQAER